MNAPDPPPPGLHGHVLVVDDNCRLLADGLAKTPKYDTVLTPTMIENIYAASPLHDIGKAGIPARILRLADVYDALMSRRAYKEAYSFEETRRTILKERGITVAARDLLPAPWGAWSPSTCFPNCSEQPQTRLGGS